MRRDGRGSRVETTSSTTATLAAVSLPPLQPRPQPRPGGALRSPPRPPTPPPRPESSLVAPPPPPQQSRAGSPPVLLHNLPPSLSALDSPISLTTPRTVSARTQNLYVDTPFQGGGGPPSNAPHRPPVPSAVKRSSRTVIKTQSVSHPPTSNSTVITQAPHSCTKPEKAPASHSSASYPTTTTTESIICVRCGRCRCAACATPRALPSAWLCDNSCLCSAESALDTATCMCCVKAAFYHCGERVDQDCDKEDSWVDSPCSCSHNKW